MSGSSAFGVMNDTIPQEILMIGLGHNGSRPLLFMRQKNDILIYRVFRYTQGHLKIRLRKLKHGIIYSSINDLHNIKNEDEDFEMDDEFSIKSVNVPKLRHFQNVNGYDGVCVCGTGRSYLVFLTTKGELRAHRFDDTGIDSNGSSIKCFASFNNVNCPNGFLYFNISDNDLKISTLQPNLTLDSHWPMQKVMLRCTPHHIVYHRGL